MDAATRTPGSPTGTCGSAGYQVTADAAGSVYVAAISGARSKNGIDSHGWAFSDEIGFLGALDR